jgi:hypothetical protein
MQYLSWLATYTLLGLETEAEAGRFTFYSNTILPIFQLW